MAIDRGIENAGKAAPTDIRDFSDIWEAALAGSDTGIWDRNIVTGQTRYSVTWFAMLGYAYETPQISLMESVARFHPDDLPRVQAAIQAHLEQRTAFYEVEHRMRCQDGSYKWVLCRGRVTERAADGTPLRMVGTTTDISTAHALAEQLKAQNAKLRDNTAKLSALTRELAERTAELRPPTAWQSSVHGAGICKTARSIFRATYGS